MKNRRTQYDGASNKHSLDQAKMATDQSADSFSQASQSRQAIDSSPPGPADRILESYMRHLEQGGSDLPEEFFRASNRGEQELGLDRTELLQNLASIKLVHEAGQKIQSQVAGISNLPEPGTRLGDFQILRPLGRGGMGIVFLAKQISLDRLVALKILAFGGTIDPVARSRFQLEARAAAALLHPNIVSVHAVGSDNGVEFYVMQYIAGQTLQHAMQTAPVDTGTTRAAAANLSTAKTAAAETLADSRKHHVVQTHQIALDQKTSVVISGQIADALDHAHRAGIVHRDVKPSNILIDESGKPWLADFGLAHVEQEGTLTAPGAILGSLRYMSPEQLDPDEHLLDHRTDMYSLGATLYEMLTGQPAVNGRDRKEVLRQLVTGQIVRPRKLQPSISRDLETVVLKAMESEPSMRYAKMQDFAADLRAILQGRSISARPPTFPDRIAKWSRRNRAIVCMGGTGLLLATVGLVIALAIISSSRNAAVLANKETEQARLLAETNLDQGLGAISQFYRDTSKSLEEQPGARGTRRRLLETARAFFENLATSNQKSAIPLAELAESEVMLASICAIDHDFDEAIQVANESLETIKKLRVAGDEDSKADHFEAHARFALSKALNGQKKLEAALDQADKCVSIVDSLRDANSPHIWQFHIYRWQRGSILLQMNRFDEAISQLKRAVDDIRVVLIETPNDYQARVDLAQACFDLGVAQSEIKNQDAALITFLEGIEEVDSLTKVATINFSKRYWGAQLAFQVGKIYFERMNWVAAEKYLRTSVDLYRGMAIETPDDSEFVNAQTLAESLLGQVCLKTEKPDEAADLLTRSAEKMLARIESKDSPMIGANLGGAINNLATIELQRDHLDKAIELFNRAIRISTEAHRQQPNDLNPCIFLVNHYYNLHSAYRRKNELENALKSLDKAADWQDQVLQVIPDHHDERMKLIEILNQQAGLLGKLDRWSETPQVVDAGMKAAEILIDADYRAELTEEHQDWFLTVAAETGFRADDMAEFRSQMSRRIEAAEKLADDSQLKRWNLILKDLQTLEENDTDLGDRKKRTALIEEFRAIVKSKSK